MALKEEMPQVITHKDRQTSRATMKLMEDLMILMKGYALVWDNDQHEIQNVKHTTF